MSEFEFAARREQSSEFSCESWRDRGGEESTPSRIFFERETMIHILIALLLIAGQHKAPKPVHHPCQTCVWVMQ